MKFSTHLISGAGNTFHIAYGDELESVAENSEVLRDIACRICASVPADGFILLRRDSMRGVFGWRFYNRDGSQAEMCGNATRCVGLFIKKIIGSQDSSWDLETMAGVINIRNLDGDKFKIRMTAISESPSNLGFYCDTGVPHLVIEKLNLDDLAGMRAQAQVLRHHPQFAPKGTNVTFAVLMKSPAEVRAISFERGVEDFTEACGTGAMAAAFYNLTKRGVLETQVEMPGGSLMMDLSDLRAPTMTGSAVLLGSYIHEVTI